MLPPNPKASLLGAALLGALLSTTAPAQDRSADGSFTLADILAPAWCYELVSARNTDRIAWLANAEGRRNVYTAAAPDFSPVKLTDFQADDGIDLTALRISADGSTLVFVRGHGPNREGWIANPGGFADGVERAIWAVRTAGGRPFKVVAEDDPVLSPDGRFVVFERNGQIHGAPVDAAAEPAKPDRPLFRTHGTDRNPQWSPDGAMIAFESDRGDHGFIGIYHLATRRISYLAPSVDIDSSPTWSPDGRRVAFLRRPGLPFARAGARADRFGSRGEERGAGRRGRPGRGRPTEGGAAMPKGYATSALPGGHTLAMYAADVKTGQAVEFWHNDAGDRTFGRLRSITWAGDHAMFELEPDNWQRCFSVPIAGTGSSEPAVLTPGEGIAEHVGLSADGRTLFFSTNVGDIDRRHVWRVATGGGEPELLTAGDGIETYPVALASGGGFAMLSATSRRPQSVAVAQDAKGPPRVLFPELPQRFPLTRQVDPIQVVLTAADGTKFHNQVFVPRNLREGERRPAILFTHGGPIRQMLLGYHYRSFYHAAYAVNQYLCSRGYVVISANYRGGIGYGKAFRRAPRRGSAGNSEYQDVVAAGRYLQGRPDVDPKRIGLWGLSYGGLITAQGLARNSDIFAAGVDIAGVHHWGNGSDVTNVAFQSSPVAAVSTWKSPVLLIHADDDRNVAFSQTTGLVQMLRAHGVPHEVMVFPDDVHSPLLHRSWLQIYRAMDGFFARHLGPAAAEAGARRQR